MAESAKKKNRKNKKKRFEKKSENILESGGNKF